MAEEKKHKSPEELGEAVGKKIEELFGGLFDEPAAEAVPVHTQVAQKAGPGATAVPERASQPASAAVTDGRPGAETPPTKAAPVKAAVSPALRPAGRAFEDIIEHIEILVLNMEWEVSAQIANELGAEFRALAEHFPPEGQARTILSMNRRTLQRSGLPGAAPHPILIRMLQDSLSALRLLHRAGGTPPPKVEELFSDLVQNYKEIMKAPSAQGPSAVPSEPQAMKDGSPNYEALVKKIGTAVHSLEEVSRRLTRILGVMRQGGEMSSEEITRRLGTLELLLSERVGQLASSQKELAGLGVEPSAVRQAATAPDGIVLTIWEGLHLAIPSSVVTGLYPLNKEQAEKFCNDDVITLGNRPVKRLPLKKPAGSESRPKTLPAWLLHLSIGNKDFFVLADKSVGFRRTPAGVDILRETRVKIGPTVYALINRAAFRQ